MSFEIRNLNALQLNIKVYTARLMCNLIFVAVVIEITLEHYALEWTSEIDLDK